MDIIKAYRAAVKSGSKWDNVKTVTNDFLNTGIV